MSESFVTVAFIDIVWLMGTPPRFGVTETPIFEEATTVSVVEPVTLPEVAEIVVEPALSAVARPVVLIVAVAVLLEAQVTLLVRFCVLLSENVPVAVNCCVPPAAIEGFAGVTAIDTSVAAPIVSDKVALWVCAGLPEPVTLNVSDVLLTTCVGVPAMAPVEAFSFKPAGHVPLVKAHVYGVVPPVAASVAL